MGVSTAEEGAELRVVVVFGVAVLLCLEAAVLVGVLSSVTAGGAVGGPAGAAGGSAGGGLAAVAVGAVSSFAVLAGVCDESVEEAL